MVKAGIEPNLSSHGGKRRSLTKEDFSQQSAIFLRPRAQFDYLVALPDSRDRARTIIEAMESIEKDYENLRGVLPKGEYQELDNQVLGQLLRTLNPDELKKVSGDVFGRIYEHFLTQFTDQKAHNGGEFFTPRFTSLAERPCAKPRARHRSGPSLRLGRHVCVIRLLPRAAAKPASHRLALPG